MLPDLQNMRKMSELMSDDGFVDALTRTEQVIRDVEGTIDRVEKVEGEAAVAVQEANQALTAVDQRLDKVDETISLLEAKIEAAFSVAFFFFALNMWMDGEILMAAGLFFMGLLGASSLVVTIVTMPQVRKLRKVGDYATDRIDGQSERSERRRQQREANATLDSDGRGKEGRREQGGAGEDGRSR